MSHDVCSNCGAPRYRGARFCNICGLAFPAEEPTPPPQAKMVCPNGCAVDEPDAAFCVLCGAKLVPAAAPETPAEKPKVTCPNGCEVSDPDALFCDICGALLIRQGKEAEPAPIPEPKASVAEAPAVVPIAEIPSPFRYIPLAQAVAENESEALQEKESFGEETILTRPAPIQNSEVQEEAPEEVPEIVPEVENEEVQEETPDVVPEEITEKPLPEPAPETTETPPARAPRTARPAVAMRALTDDDMKK